MPENRTYWPSNSGVGAGPQLLVGAEVLVGDRAARGEGRRSQGFELLFHPAHADAQDEAAPGQHVQGGQDLGGQDGRTVGDNHHAGHQADVFGDAGQVGQQGELLEILAALSGGELAAHGVGVGRVDLVGDEDVVTGHHAVETQAVAGLGDLRQGAGLGVGAVVGQVESELHCGAPELAGEAGR